MFVLEKDRRDAFIAAQENLKEVMQEILEGDNQSIKKVILEINEFYITSEGDMTYVNTHIEDEKDLRECLVLYEQSLKRIFPSMAVLEGKKDARKMFQGFHKNYQELLKALVA